MGKNSVLPSLPLHCIAGIFHGLQTLCLFCYKKTYLHACNNDAVVH